MHSNNELYSIKSLCDKLVKNSQIDTKLYEKFDVKRGLRKSDGTGVMAGITNICNVHGYILNEGEREPMEGELIYRGHNVKDIIANVEANNRYGFEETIYLLLFGELPDKEGLDCFSKFISQSRELPEGFIVDMILKAPSPNIMNKLARSVLALYSYDDYAEEKGIESEMHTAISIIAKLPVIMTAAYQVKKSHYCNESMVMHPLNPQENTAQSILSMLRTDRAYTEAEAQLLDALLILHAEHGGGNNSTFACRVLTSSGTDAYSAYSAAIGSLKGPRHGGANIKVMQMLEDFKSNVKDWNSDGQVADHMRRVLRKEANDFSGLIYGMGHAVYTLSDPREKILRDKAAVLAKGTEIEAEFKLLETIERLTPEMFAEIRGEQKVICSNVDMYSGLVYKMLGIPEDLYTPLFAISRMAGWAAHRMEEILTCNKIMRPAYKAIAKPRIYTDINDR